MKKVLLTATILVSTLLSGQNELTQLINMPPIRTEGEISIILEEYEDTIDSTQKALMFFIMINSFDSVEVFESQATIENKVVTEMVKAITLYTDSVGFTLYAARADGYFDEYLIIRQKL